MKLIKAQFISKYTGKPQGAHYTYDAGVHDVEVGDLVQLNENGQGIITQVDVPESEIAAFRDKLKTIIGKVDESEIVEEIELNELKIIEKQLPSITTNAEELKAHVKAMLTKYQGIIATEESFKGLKKDRAELNRISKEIDASRIKIKKELSKPITEFEDEMKSIVSLVKDTSDNLNEQITAFEDKVKNEKHEDLKAYVLEQIEEHGYPQYFAERINILPTYYNLSTSLADGKKGIDTQFIALVAIEKEKEKAIESIKSMCETLSTNLDTPLNADIYLNRFDGRNLTEVIQAITVDSQRQLKIENDTKEKLRLKIEREEREKIEAERIEAVATPIQEVVEESIQEEIKEVLVVEIETQPETLDDGKVRRTWEVIGTIESIELLKDWADQFGVEIKEG